MEPIRLNMAFVNTPEFVSLIRCSLAQITTIRARINYALNASFTTQELQRLIKDWPVEINAENRLSVMVFEVGYRHCLEAVIRFAQWFHAEQESGVRPCLDFTVDCDAVLGEGWASAFVAACWVNVYPEYITVRHGHFFGVPSSQQAVIRRAQRIRHRRYLSKKKRLGMSQQEMDEKLDSVKELGE